MDALNKPLPTARQRRETYLIFKLTDMQGGLSFAGIALVFFGLILIGNVPSITLLVVLLALPCLALGQSRNAVKFSARVLSILRKE